jgi:acyl carrier protein
MQFLKALWKALQGRDFAKEFEDETFYRSYYAATPIPKTIPLRVRKVLIEQLGSRWWYVKPEDWLLEDDLDFADLLEEIGEEFGMSIPFEDMQQLEPVFDAVVRYIAGRIRQAG